MFGAQNWLKHRFEKVQTSSTFRAFCPFRHPSRRANQLPRKISLDLVLEIEVIAERFDFLD